MKYKASDSYLLNDEQNVSVINQACLLVRDDFDSVYGHF